MNIRFFDKETGKDVGNEDRYVVDCEGGVYDGCFALRLDIGWEVINEEAK